MGRQIYPASSRSTESTNAMHQERATMGNLPPRAESIEDEYALRGNNGSGHTDASGLHFHRIFTISTSPVA
jgi:hypothetical protein